MSSYFFIAPSPQRQASTASTQLPHRSTASADALLCGPITLDQSPVNAVAALSPLILCERTDMTSTFYSHKRKREESANTVCCEPQEDENENNNNTAPLDAHQKLQEMLSALSSSSQAGYPAFSDKPLPIPISDMRSALDTRPDSTLTLVDESELRRNDETSGYRAPPPSSAGSSPGYPTNWAKDALSPDSAVDAPTSFPSLHRVVARLHAVAPGFPEDLLLECIVSLHYCYYGYCEHSDPACLALKPKKLERSWEDKLTHYARAAKQSGVLASYIARLLACLPVRPHELKRGLEYALRLRRKLEQGTDTEMAMQSRVWGTHYLCLLAGCLIAHKWSSDESRPAMSEWGDAGGFSAEVMRSAEMEMLKMLDWQLE